MLGSKKLKIPLILVLVLVLVFILQKPISLFVVSYIAPGRHRFEQRMLSYALQTVDLPSNHIIESDPHTMAILITEILPLVNLYDGFDGVIKWKEEKSSSFFLYEPKNHHSALLIQFEESHPLTKSIRPKISDACFEEQEKKELEDYFNGILKRKMSIYQKYHAPARDCPMRFNYEGSQYGYLFEVYSLDNQSLQIILEWPI